jgi:hypothetical protein
MVIEISLCDSSVALRNPQGHLMRPEVFPVEGLLVRFQAVALLAFLKPQRVE